MIEENRSDEGSAGPPSPAPEERAEAPFSSPPPQMFAASREPSWLPPDLLDRLLAWARAHVLGRDPTFFAALAPFALITAVLFSRWPGTNYIFDEQEALLANPYVNATGGLRFIDAIHRDFWGLPADRSIGSYRPIPNFFWRSIWQLSSRPEGLFRQPFVHHIYNVLFHAINATLITLIVWAWTRRRGQAWIAGLLFATCAVLTEAVSGIVGIADVLGGMGALLALLALSLPGWAMPFAVFMAVGFGLFCKESALVCVPLVPFAALLVAPLTHPERPARVLRAALALAASASAFYLYVELRKRWFPSPLPKELAEAPFDDAPLPARLAHEFLVWFHQAALPKDPLNNPLVDADRAHRVAGALRVYLRGLGQIVYPSPLSGDYSFPQEPVPDRLVFPQSVAGAALTALPPLGSLVIWIVAMVRERRARRALGEPAAPSAADADARSGLRLAGLGLTLFALTLVSLELLVLGPRGLPLAWRGIPLWVAAVPAGILGLGVLTEGMAPLARPDPRPLGSSGLILIGVGLTWVVVSYFPHSNIPIVLPTVRAERFWYFPAIGTTLVLAVLASWLHAAAARRGRPWIAPALLVPVLRAPGRASVPARDGLPQRRRLLARHQGRCPAQRQGPPQLLRDEGCPRRSADPPRREPHRHGARPQVGDGARLHGRHPLPHAQGGRGVGGLPRGLRSRAQRPEPHCAGAPVPLRREGAHPPRGRAARAGGQARGVVDRLSGDRHAEQLREEQGRRPQVPAEGLQRGAERVSS